MAIKVTPLADRVVIETAAAEEKTAGGIIIPDTAKEKPKRGTVVAVGKGKTDEPYQIQFLLALEEIVQSNRPFQTRIFCQPK